jgi:hypothetical protein
MCVRSMLWENHPVFVLRTPYPPVGSQPLSRRLRCVVGYAQRRPSILVKEGIIVPPMWDYVVDDDGSDDASLSLTFHAEGMVGQE